MKNILRHWICNTKSCKSFVHHFQQHNGFIGENNGNKYLILTPVDENKDTLKKCEEIWNQIKIFSSQKNNNSDDYSENYMKIGFDSDDDFPLKKTL